MTDIVLRKELKMVLIKKKVGTLSKKVISPSPEIVLTLPKTVSVPITELGGYSTLIYGEKKIGKTTLASEFPSAFFMMLEPGAKALEVYQRPVQSWQEFKEYVKLLQKDSFFKTIVVDPVDIAYKFCSSYVCKKKVIEHPSDEEWGKGWEAVRDEFTTEINKLLGMKKGVILISHATEKEIKTRSGIKYHKIMATLTGQAQEVLVSIVDIWAYYCYEGKTRMLVVEGDDHIGAGHRLLKHFKYTDGTPIAEIPMGKSSKEGYLNLIKAFNNQLQKGGTAAKKIVVVRKS